MSRNNRPYPSRIPQQFPRQHNENDPHISRPHCAQIISAGQFNLAHCKASLPTNGSIADGVVDSDGNQATSVADARGYSYATCLEVCGSGIDTTTNFTDVVQQVTLWFLPYLTLLAQIPFFTEDKSGDVTVSLLTIDTPMLALYSLFVSLFNWKWIKSQKPTSSADDGIASMADILPDILGRLQQYPMTVIDSEMLASAIALRENYDWWVKLREQLRNRERRLDASGTAQLFLAGIVYIFAVVEALAKLGGMYICYQSYLEFWN